MKKGNETVKRNSKDAEDTSTLEDVKTIPVHLSHMMTDENCEVNYLSTMSTTISCPVMHWSPMVPKNVPVFECEATFCSMFQSSSLDVKHGPLLGRPPDNAIYLEQIPDGGSVSISMEENPQDLSFDSAHLCFDKIEGSDQFKMKVRRNDQLDYEGSQFSENLQSSNSVHCKESPAPDLDGPFDITVRQPKSNPESEEETSEATEISISEASPTVIDDKKPEEELDDVISKEPTEFKAANSDSTAAGLDLKDKSYTISEAESEVRKEEEEEGFLVDSDAKRESFKGTSLCEHLYRGFSTSYHRKT